MDGQIAQYFCTGYKTMEVSANVSVTEWNISTQRRP